MSRSTSRRLRNLPRSRRKLFLILSSRLLSGRAIGSDGRSRAPLAASRGRTMRASAPGSSHTRAPVSTRWWIGEAWRHARPAADRLRLTLALSPLRPNLTRWMVNMVFMLPHAARTSLSLSAWFEIIARWIASDRDGAERNSSSTTLANGCVLRVSLSLSIYIYIYLIHITLSFPFVVPYFSLLLPPRAA